MAPSKGTPRGNRLAELREARFSGPTLESRRQLAVMVRVSTRTIYRWEVGGHAKSRTSTAAYLSEIFGVSPAYLLGIDDNGEGNGPGLRAVA